MKTLLVMFAMMASVSAFSVETSNVPADSVDTAMRRPVVCYAQNHRGEVFEARGWDERDVQDRAVDRCWHSGSHHCWATGCHHED